MTAKRHMVAIGAEFDMTSIQAITLLLLDTSTPRPMKSFCTLYHCDASNVTGIIDGLEKKGFVSRQNDPTDRRIKVIQLEPDGKRLQKKILERISIDSGYLFDPLDQDETQQFVSIVGKLAASSETCAQ